MRRVDLRAVATEVGEAEVVGQHHDDVRRARRRRRPLRPAPSEPANVRPTVPSNPGYVPRSVMWLPSVPTSACTYQTAQGVDRDSQPALGAGGRRSERQRVAEDRVVRRVQQRLQPRRRGRGSEHLDRVELPQPFDEHVHRGSFAPHLGQRAERWVAELLAARPLRVGDHRRVRSARGFEHLVVRQPGLHQQPAVAGSRSDPSRRRASAARAPAPRRGSAVRAAPGRSRGTRRAPPAVPAAAGAAPPRCR